MKWNSVRYQERLEDVEEHTTIPCLMHWGKKASSCHVLSSGKGGKSKYFYRYLRSFFASSEPAGRTTSDASSVSDRLKNVLGVEPLVENSPIYQGRTRIAGPITRSQATLRTKWLTSASFISRLKRARGAPEPIGRPPIMT